MCQCLAARSPSINQVTKHAEFPQTLYIGNVVVEMPVVRQRKVPQIRTASNTVEIPPLKFVGRVMEAPVIMQMRQCRLSRSRRASRSVYTNRPSINQGDQACRDPTWKTAGAVRRQSSGCAGTVTDDDSSEESDRGSDRSSIFDGLMAKQEDPPVEEESPHGWVTLQDHLGAKASLPGSGPDTGAGEKKAMTAGLGPETEGLGAGSCLSGRQTTDQCSAY